MTDWQGGDVGRGLAHRHDGATELRRARFDRLFRAGIKEEGEGRAGFGGPDRVNCVGPK